MCSGSYDPGPGSSLWLVSWYLEAIENPFPLVVNIFIESYAAASLNNLLRPGETLFYCELAGNLDCLVKLTCFSLYILAGEYVTGLGPSVKLA